MSALIISSLWMWLNLKMVCNTVTYSDLQKKLQCSCMLCNCSRRLRTCCSTRVWSWTSSECSTAVFLLSVCVLCQYLLYLLWLVNTQKCMKSQVITNELFLMISIKRWYMTTEAHVYSCKMSFLIFSCRSNSRWRTDCGHLFLPLFISSITGKWL